MGCSGFISDWGSTALPVNPSDISNMVKERITDMKKFTDDRLKEISEIIKSFNGLISPQSSSGGALMGAMALGLGAGEVANQSQHSIGRGGSLSCSGNLKDDTGYSSHASQIISQINNLINRIHGINLPTIPHIPNINTNLSLTLPSEPDQPSIYFPQAPTLFEFVVPSPPSISFRQDYPDIPVPPELKLPQDVPDLDVDIPEPFEIDFSYIEQLFSDLDAHKNQIYNLIPIQLSEIREIIENLKTTIPDRVDLSEFLEEIEVFARGEYLNKFTPEVLSQFDHAQNKAVNDLLNKSQNGFSLPPAFIMANLRDTISSFRDKRMELFYDYNKQKLNLYSDGLKFKYDLYLRAISFIKEYDLKLSGLLHDIAKSQIEYLRTMLETYRFIMESELQLIRAVLEYFKHVIETKMARIKYAELQVSVNNQLLDLYKTKLSAEGMKLELYGKLVESIKTRVDIISQINQSEKLKVDVYTAHLQGLSLLAQVNRDRISLYSEQLRGEGLKIETYKSKIQAYQAIVSAKLGEFDGKVKAILAEADLYKTNFALYSSYYDAIRAVVSGYANAIDGLSRPLSGLAQLYSALVGRATAEANLQAQLSEDATRLTISDKDVGARIKESETRLALARTEVMTTSLKTLATIVGNVVSSALSGIHVAAQLSATGHASKSETYSKALSRACSEQYIESV